MKRVLVLPLIVVLLLSFSSFGESTKSTVKTGTTASIVSGSKNNTATHSTRKVEKQSGNWSKIKSLFL